MRVELPWPNPKLAPNRRNGKHWTVTHDAKLEAFGAAATLTMQAQRSTGYEPPMDGPVALAITFCAPDKRRRDLDGLLSSCKASLDAVAQVLGIDDARFEPVTLRRGETTKGGAVVVEVGC